MVHNRPPQTTGGGGGVKNGGPGGDDFGQEPSQTPDGSPHDGAPAGDYFGADLPVTSVPGGAPATTGGFTPNPAQDKLPPPGSSEGNQTAPSGNRR